MTDWTHRLRLRHMQFLTTLADSGNLSQAAKLMHVTQPALSKWLKELEDDLGLVLFERHSRGLRPTPAGMALIEHARRILNDLDRTRTEMEALRDGGSRHIAIGSSPAAAATLVPPAVLRLLEVHPSLRVKVLEGTMNYLLDLLMQGQVDVIVGRIEGKALRLPILYETLYTEPLCAVTSTTHPLAGRATVEWDEVYDYCWAVWPSGSPIRALTDSMLAATGRRLPSRYIESGSMLTNLGLLNQSDVITIMSWRVAEHFQRQHLLHILPLDIPDQGAVGMIWRNEPHQPQALADLLDTLRREAARPPDAAA